MGHFFIYRPATCGFRAFSEGFKPFHHFSMRHGLALAP